MQSKVELQNEIDTNNVVKPVSYYKNYAVNPIGSVPANLTAITNPQVTFELPADSLINFSRLIFSFSRGATPATHATNTYVAIPANFFSFLSRIEVYSGSGNLKLLDLTNADIYSKCSAHLNNDFLKNSNSNGLIYSKKGDDFIPNSNKELDGAVVTKDAVLTYQNYEIGGLSSGTANQPLPSNNYNIRLGDAYPDTIFNLNKTIYIAKSVFIRMTFNNTSRIVCGISAGLPLAINNVTMPISNFALKTYTENDPLIIDQVKKQSMNGASYVMPDIVSNQISVSGAGVKGLQSKFTNMTGNADSRLYKCYSILNSTGTGSAGTILPTSNYQNGKYNYLSLFVNSQNILNLDVAANDDIHHMILQHKDHSITNDDILKDNGVICNVFDTSLAHKEYNVDELKGLTFGNGDITINWQYTIPANLTSPAFPVYGSASYDNYQFGVILRKLYAKDGQLSSTVI